MSAKPLPLVKNGAGCDRDVNQGTLIQVVNADRACLENGRDGGGHDVRIVEVGVVEGLDQVETTHLSLSDPTLTVEDDGHSAFDRQPLEDMNLISALQQIATTAGHVAEIAVRGGQMVVNGDQPVTSDHSSALRVGTEDSRGRVDDVRLAVVTREVVDRSSADAAVDLPAMVNATEHGSVGDSATGYLLRGRLDFSGNLRGRCGGDARRRSLSSRGNDMKASLIVHVEVVMAQVHLCSKVSVEGCLSKMWIQVAVKIHGLGRHVLISMKLELSMDEGMRIRLQ